MFYTHDWDSMQVKPIRTAKRLFPVYCAYPMTWRTGRVQELGNGRFYCLLTAGNVYTDRTMPVTVFAVTKRIPSHRPVSAKSRIRQPLGMDSVIRISVM